MNLVGLPWYNGAMKQPDRDIPTYQAVQFRPWTGKHGVAFVSDLVGPLRESHEWYRQVWSDACDVGFWMQGNGLKPKLFTLLSSDERSDTRSWTFRSQDGFEVVIYNT